MTTPLRMTATPTDERLQKLCVTRAYMFGPDLKEKDTRVGDAKILRIQATKFSMFVSLEVSVALTECYASWYGVTEVLFNDRRMIQRFDVVGRSLLDVEEKLAREVLARQEEIAKEDDQ